MDVPVTPGQQDEMTSDSSPFIKKKQRRHCDLEPVPDTPNLKSNVASPGIHLTTEEKDILASENFVTIKMQIHNSQWPLLAGTYPEKSGIIKPMVLDVNHNHSYLHDMVSEVALNYSGDPVERTKPSIHKPRAEHDIIFFIMPADIPDYSDTTNVKNLVELTPLAGDKKITYDVAR